MIKWKYYKKQENAHTLEDFMDVVVCIQHIKNEKRIFDFCSVEEWIEWLDDIDIHSIEPFSFRPIALALIKRTFPSLVANKIVGVQPMSQPVGLAYDMRIIYDDKDKEDAKDNIQWD